MEAFCCAPGCNDIAFSLIYFIEKRDGTGKGYRCKKHRDELGFFDQKGRLDDKRIKRDEDVNV